MIWLYGSFRLKEVEHQNENFIQVFLMLDIEDIDPKTGRETLKNINSLSYLSTKNAQKYIYTI